MTSERTRALRPLILAGLTMAVIAAGMSVARASDLITVPVDSGAGAVPVATATHAGFDWNGFYAGFFAGAQRSSGSDTQLAAGVAAGVNAQFDFFLIGGEVTLQGLTDKTLDTAYGTVVGKAGLVVTDDVLLYAAAGYGHDLGGATRSDLLLGGGVEFAVSDDLSLRAQYLHGFDATSSNVDSDQVTLGANFHF